MKYLDSDTITTYWLGYDRDNMVVKYGKGYAMEETTLLTLWTGSQVLKSFQKSESSGLFSLESVIQKEREKQFFSTEQNTTLRRIKRKP